MALSVRYSQLHVLYDLLRCKVKIMCDLQYMSCNMTHRTSYNERPVRSKFRLIREIKWRCGAMCWLIIHEEYGKLNKLLWSETSQIERCSCVLCRSYTTWKWAGSQSIPKQRAHEPRGLLLFLWGSLVRRPPHLLLRP